MIKIKNKLFIVLLLSSLVLTGCGKGQDIMDDGTDIESDLRESVPEFLGEYFDDDGNLVTTDENGVTTIIEKASDLEDEEDATQEVEAPSANVSDKEDKTTANKPQTQQDAKPTGSTKQPETKQPVASGKKTTYGKIEYKDEVIPYRELEAKLDYDKPLFEWGVLTKGVDGLRRTEFRKVYVDGKYSHDEIVKKAYTVKEPVNGQEWIGMKRELTEDETWHAKSNQEAAAEVVRLTNEERKKHGLPAFKEGSAESQRIADIRSKEVVDNFSHDSISGTGYGYGENLARTTGPHSPNNVVKGWMNSPRHRELMLSQSVNSIAVSRHIDGNGWTYYVLIGDYGE